MATRQRARASNKAPVMPVPPSDVESSNPAAAAPASDFTPVEDLSASSRASETKARFNGEQLVYRNREERIAESAYLYAEARGFQAGYELEDWLKAEKEVDALLAGSNQAD